MQIYYQNKRTIWAEIKI